MSLVAMPHACWKWKWDSFPSKRCWLKKRLRLTENFFFHSQLMTLLAHQRLFSHPAAGPESKNAPPRRGVLRAMLVAGLRSQLSPRRLRRADFRRLTRRSSLIRFESYLPPRAKWKRDHLKSIRWSWPRMVSSSPLIAVSRLMITP
jgi:hypothetical protein